MWKSELRGNHEGGERRREHQSAHRYIQNCYIKYRTATVSTVSDGVYCRMIAGSEMDSTVCTRMS